MSRHLVGLKSALSNLKTSLPPQESQIKLTNFPPNFKQDLLELPVENPEPITRSHSLRRQLKNPGPNSMKEIFIVDLVSDSEVDSEAETVA